MLNTDLHNDKVENLMTEEVFKKNCFKIIIKTELSTKRLSNAFRRI